LWGKDAYYNTLHLESQQVSTHGVVVIKFKGESICESSIRLCPFSHMKTRAYRQEYANRHFMYTHDVVRYKKLPAKPYKTSIKAIAKLHNYRKLNKLHNCRFSIGDVAAGVKFFYFKKNIYSNASKCKAYCYIIYLL
jgi:hypothetical protein